MAWDADPQPSPKNRQRRPGVEIIQVRLAGAAVRAAEPLNPDHSPRKTANDLGPKALAFVCVVAEPDFHDLQQGRKVVDVPVFPLWAAQMARQPSCEASWPEGTAQVNVVAGREQKAAQPSDLDQLLHGGVEKESIGSWPGKGCGHERRNLEPGRLLGCLVNFTRLSPGTPAGFRKA